MGSGPTGASGNCSGAAQPPAVPCPAAIPGNAVWRGTSGITPRAAACSDSSGQCSPAWGPSCSPSAASCPTTGSKGSVTPVWSGPFQQLLPEHRAMEGTQGTTPCTSWASTLHNTSHKVLEVPGAGTRIHLSLLQPRGCPRLSVVSADKAPAPFPPPPQSGEGLLCQTPPHAPAPTNPGSGWTHQDGPPGCCEPAASSGAGNHTRPPALAPAPALPHCQAPPQFIAHSFKEKQHPVHAVPSRVVRSWPWIHVGAARTRCPLQPQHAALAAGLLLSTPRPCRTRDTPVPRASSGHVAQAVQG